MRLIYDRDTLDVIGVLPDRITYHFPPSYVGDNSTYLDIDYDENDQLKHPRIAELEELGTGVLTKRIKFVGDGFELVDRPADQFATVMVDLKNPKLHKDVANYTARAEKAGGTVKIEDNDMYVYGRIYKGDKLAGEIVLHKLACNCGYTYQKGVVWDRTVFPHYLGMSRLIKYLADKGFTKLDMGGLADVDDGLNTFKRKFGTEVASGA